MKSWLLSCAVFILMLLPWASAFSQGLWRARSDDYDEDYDDFWADDEYYSDEEDDSEGEEVTSEEISNSIEDDDAKETIAQDSQEDGDDDELSGEEDNSIEEESEEEDSNISVLVDRIGEVDRLLDPLESLAKSFSSLSPSEVYADLTSTSKVIKKLIQVTVEWTSKNLGWLGLSAIWSFLRPSTGLREDVSRTVELGTAPLEAVQEIISVGGAKSLTMLLWLISTTAAPAATEGYEAREHTDHLMELQRRLWEDTSPHISVWDDTEGEYRRLSGSGELRFSGTEQLLTVLDEMFSSTGTADFLKDNFFESAGAFLFWSTMWLLP